MLAYAMAVAPDWGRADLGVLIEFHEFVMSKALESVQGRRPQVSVVIQADYETRTRWQLYLSLHPTKNLTDAIKDTNSNYGHLWAGIHAVSLPSPLIAVGDQARGRQHLPATLPGIISRELRFVSSIFDFQISNNIL